MMTDNRILAVSYDTFRGKSAEELWEAIEDALKRADTPILVRNQHFVGAVVAPEAVKELVLDRMLKRFETDPALIDSLRKRLTEDEIVE